MWRRIGIIVLGLNLSGCCFLAKRSCFKPCLPPRTVRVEVPCQLPPKLNLPRVTMMPCSIPGMPPDSVTCFNKTNAGLLAQRQADMKDWIKEARTRCGPKKSADPANLDKPSP